MACGSTYNTYTWTLPAITNYDSVATLNQSLQSFCIANGLYIINGANNVYFTTLVSNETTYQFDLGLLLVPTSAGAYTAPSNWPGYPTTTKTPQ